MKINRIDQKTGKIQYFCMNDIKSDLYYNYEYTYMHCILHVIILIIIEFLVPLNDLHCLIFSILF